mmetsp:Transcript_14775/g.26448  ORF Transcript_14775/g.26448 Transcript_14775/m.26448 type:complete len:186 (-) Transcript_14775:24-581(-)
MKTSTKLAGILVLAGCSWLGNAAYLCMNGSVADCESKEMACIEGDNQKVVKKFEKFSNMYDDLRALKIKSYREIEMFDSFENKNERRKATKAMQATAKSVRKAEKQVARFSKRVKVNNMECRNPNTCEDGTFETLENGNGYANKVCHRNAYKSEEFICADGLPPIGEEATRKTFKCVNWYHPDSL